MPLYLYRCRCGKRFERLRSMSENVSQSPCPRCARAATQDYQSKRLQIGEIDGTLVGLYGFGPKDNPYPIIQDGPQRGMTVVPNKRALFENQKKLDEKAGTKTEWK